MLVLARAWMGIEEEAADELAVVVHLVGFDQIVPGRRSPWTDFHAEHVLREPENAVAHIFVGEIFSRLLLVVTVGLLLYDRGEVGIVPRGDFRRTGLELLQHRELFGIIAI